MWWCNLVKLLQFYWAPTKRWNVLVVIVLCLLLFPANLVPFSTLIFFLTLLYLVFGVF